MQNKKAILSLTIALLAGISSMAQVALHGLFTPIQLSTDTTKVYLRDYLADEPALGISLPAGIRQLNQSRDTLLFIGQLPTKMGSLGIQTKSGEKALVLINPSSRTIHISIPVQMISGNEVRIIGSFNGWNRESEVLLPIGKGTYSHAYQLEPGRYEYKLYVDGAEMLDPNNPDTVPNGLGGYNNVLTVKPESGRTTSSYTVQWGSKEADKADSYSVHIQNQDAHNQYLVLWNNTLLQPICDKSMKPTCHIKIPIEAKNIKRSYLRIFAFAGSDKGRDQLIPLEYGNPVTEVTQLDRSDWHQARMYFLLVDRFYNGNPQNDRITPDASIKPIANYMGGDLIGVNQKIEEGFFQNLGVNTIWLSPITQNPYDAWGLWNKGTVHSKFSGYHGYWPIKSTVIDTRFGTSRSLERILEHAHQRDENVILDYVANHVHIQHPIYQEHKDWATPLYLPDGSKNTEKWDEHRLTTWFDDHLPTLDLRRYEVVDPMADSALFWLTHYELDGFRHDATKHIDELYWRTLTYRIRKNINKPIYQVGETYGSPQLINSYISTGMLDAQFDFNLYDAAVNAFAYDDGSLDNLIDKLQQGLETYGYHHLMGNITGNQDRVRFISLAGGDVKPSEDPKLAGWEREIGKPNAEAYQRLALVHAFNNAIPGIPCIYYGDEYGLPGAGDPDNRRMMRFSGYDLDEQALLEKVKKLNALRAEHMALLYGSTSVEKIGAHVLLIVRNYFDQEVRILINTAEENVELDLSKWPGQYSPQFNTPQEPAQKTLTLPALGFEYLIKRQ